MEIFFNKIRGGIGNVAKGISGFALDSTNEIIDRTFDITSKVVDTSIDLGKAIGGVTLTIGGEVLNTTVDIADAIKNIAGEACDKHTETAKKVLVSAAQWFVKVKDFFKNLFSINTFKILRKLVDCFGKVKDTASKVNEMLGKLQNKVIMFASFNIGEMVIFVINLICNRASFIKIINLIAQGVRKSDKGQKFFYYGKAFVEALEYVANAKRIFK